MDVIRPHLKVWNFFEDVDPVPHVLRPTATPEKSYIDGRIEGYLDVNEKLGVHIKNYLEPAWKTLNSRTQDIFFAFESDLESKHKAYLAEQNK